MSEELMFKYLSAELADQRGNAFAAYSTMLSIARTTRDPRLARRAVEMAMKGKLVAEALKAAGASLVVECLTELDGPNLVSLVLH